MHRKLKSNDYKPHKKKSTKRKKIKQTGQYGYTRACTEPQNGKHKKIEKECIKTQQTIANSLN